MTDGAPFGSGTLKLGVLAWNQHTDWPSLRDVGVLVDELGYDSLWTWDHLYPIVGDPHGPMFEGYLTLAAWAALTKRVTLGLMVGANTFRNPALVAKMATTLDHVSGGRAYLGLGGAWFETEHTAFGIPFGSSPGERLRWFDEAVELIRGMLRDEETSARGSFYRAQGVRNNPPPLQRRLPILVGGSGERKTLATVARYADAWNTGGDLERVRHKDAVLRRWCEEVGRDESEIERTLQGGSVVIRDTVEEARRAATAVSEQNGLPDFRGVVGPPEVVAERLAPQVELGFHHVYFDVPAPYDRETIERLVGEVKPLLERAIARPTA
jgi:F420-dependent oxidoreductase-like protein